MIEFTIDNTTYDAEEGMTWDEWVESEYNTGGYNIYYVTAHNVYVRMGSSNYGVYTTIASSGAIVQAPVSPSDTIVEGISYVLDTIIVQGGGGAN